MQQERGTEGPAGPQAKQRDARTQQPLPRVLRIYLGLTLLGMHLWGHLEGSRRSMHLSKALLPSSSFSDHLGPDYSPAAGRGGP